MISFLEFVFSSFLEELDQVFGILLLLLSGTRSNLYQTAFLKHFQVTESTIEHKQMVLYFITVAATVTMFTWVCPTSFKGVNGVSDIWHWLNSFKVYSFTVCIIIEDNFLVKVPITWYYRSGLHSLYIDLALGLLKS